jgi:hypothetical protein
VQVPILYRLRAKTPKMGDIDTDLE